MNAVQHLPNDSGYVGSSSNSTRASRTNTKYQIDSERRSDEWQKDLSKLPRIKIQSKQREQELSTVTIKPDLKPVKLIPKLK